MGYYNKEGKIVETVPKKSGGEKKITIKEARELGLVPRFSAVSEYKNSFMINAWREKRAIARAIEFARKDSDSSVDILTASIVASLEDESETSMGAGHEIHENIENHLGKRMVLGKYVKLVCDLDMSIFKEFKKIESERTVVTPYFGGTVDFVGYADEVTVLDFKTTKSFDQIKSPYDKWLLQLAAYKYGLEHDTIGKAVKPSKFGIVVIDQETLRWKLLEAKPEDIKDAMAEFLAILAAWHISNKLANPSQILKEALEVGK